MKNPENERAMEVADRCDAEHTQQAIKCGAEVMRTIQQMVAESSRKRTEPRPETAMPEHSRVA